MEISMEIPQNTKDRPILLAFLYVYSKEPKPIHDRSICHSCVCWHTIHNGHPGSKTNLAVHPQRDAEIECGTDTQWDFVQPKS